MDLVRPTAYRVDDPKEPIHIDDLLDPDSTEAKLKAAEREAARLRRMLDEDEG